jgi:D-tyrosyl-tRNA(Tyr) deacylase
VIVVAQRVSSARVVVDGEVVGAIGRGLCLLTCAVRDDRDDEVLWLADKVVDLRIFDDAEGRTNLALPDVAGEVLVVPQFTLAADWRKGRRPSFTGAAEPREGQRLVARLQARIAERGIPLAAGRFGALMSVDLTNEGPFTLVLDSRQMPGRSAAPRGAMPT